MIMFHSVDCELFTGSRFHVLRDLQESQEV